MCGGAPDIDDHAGCIALYASLRAPDDSPAPPPLWIERGDAPPTATRVETASPIPRFTAPAESEPPDKIPI